METMATYNVPKENMAWLREKLEKLNRRFKRVGMAGELIQLSVIREYSEKRVKRVAGRNVTEVYEYCEIAVNGQAPKAEGWQLIAQLEHTQAGNIIRSLPGQEIAEPWRTAEPLCDHCNAKRWRSDTFLLQHEDGRLAQIGRNCIKDFLGHVSPEAYAAWATYSLSFTDMMEEAEDYSRVKPLYHVNEFLTWVCAVVRSEGKYVSRTAAREIEGLQSTGDLAGRYMTGDSWLRKHFPLDPTTEDEEKALELLAWVAEQDARNDFMYNLKTVTQLNAIEYKHFGLVSAVYGAWQKAQEIEVQREIEKNGKQASEYFGSLGKRATYMLTVERITWYDTDYGTKYVVIFREGAGNRAVWKTSGAYDLEVGHVIEARATVKEHSEYNGEKQTVLQRVDWKETPKK